MHNFRRWPALLLAAAAGPSLLLSAVEAGRRIEREWRERFAPPGAGEAGGALLDHYRFLEALSPLVEPGERILIVTDRWPDFPDLAYWFGARATQRTRLDPDLLMRYLRGSGADAPREFAVEGAHRAIEAAGLAFDEAELPSLLETADVAVALDTSFELRAHAPEFETLLEWSPRKFALRRKGRPR